MKVAVLGAGAGGAASVAELVQAGHDVHFWARSAETLEPHIRLGGVAYEGKLGEGVAKPALITTDLKAAIAGVDVAVVVLPTFSHSAIASALGLPAGRRAGRLCSIPATPAARWNSPRLFRAQVVRHLPSSNSRR